VCNLITFVDEALSQIHEISQQADRNPTFN
jgi:hypothetical protein